LLPPDSFEIFFENSPEIEVEIAGKRIHLRLDSGNSDPLQLLKKTSDYLGIKQKFHPIVHHNQHQKVTYSNNVPVTVITANEEQNITVQAPTLLAEDVNPGLDNDIMPAWLFLKHFGIS
jgi:hypothetical protein